MTQDASPVVAKKKLIEVALPLDAINKAATAEKKNPFLRGHPRSMHLWWSPKPLASARALLFAQVIDDPSAHPSQFPTAESQNSERQRLFGIIEDLVKWESTNDEHVLETARREIQQNWERTCSENGDHRRAMELFDPRKPPPFHDPFAGGGAIPLEAQRLGLETHASDLNPVAVLINKAKIEIPPKFAGRPPVNPEARSEQRLMKRTWCGAQGLASDLRFYSRWMRDEAEKRIGYLYPKVRVTDEMANGRPDLQQYTGRELPVIAWLWARTVKSPNPAFADVDVPLVSTFVLSKKKGTGAYVEPLIEGGDYRLIVKVGVPPESARQGTKLGHGVNFQCVMSGSPIAGDYIKAEGRAGRMGTRLMAIVAEGDRERVYIAPLRRHKQFAPEVDPPGWRPEGDVPVRLTGGTCVPYGLDQWWKLFTTRQLVALNTLCDLVAEARERVRQDAVRAGLSDDGVPLRDDGTAAAAYAEAIGVYLSLAISKQADYGNTVSTWNHSNQNITHLFTGQAIPMAWGFAESSPIEGGLSFSSISDVIARSIEALPAHETLGNAFQADCTRSYDPPRMAIVQTDPPYYDNISYAALSDFFYVWLRRALHSTFPDLFATLTTPKSEELVMLPYRHGGKEEAEAFFLAGMTRAVRGLSRQSHPEFPMAIYYAFKQTESRDGTGVASTGWETFLDALIRSGLEIRGTWPMRTERSDRMLAMGSNALASSVVLVCRLRSAVAPLATRRELQDALRNEFPKAITDLQRSNIAPVDLAQASIGPGMAIFSRYHEVLNADGSRVSVRDALTLINATLDEVLAEQEGDFDVDSRWALTWFDQHGYAEGEYGVAEQLATAKNTSVDGLVSAGIIESRRGVVRIHQPSELDEGWDPATDSRLTVWEMTQHLIRLLESGGEQAAGELAAKLGGQSEAARDLAYRLYVVSERKQRAADALAYNGLVQSWTEIMRLARQQPATTATQSALALDGA